MLRVTIRHLLLLTACLAAALTCLKYTGEVVFVVLSNVVVAVLMVAAVMALAARGRNRAKASGFAVCMGICVAETLLLRLRT
jgi:hypothetical protein